jgi:hypothetical protein
MKRNRSRKEKRLSSCESDQGIWLNASASIFTKDFKAIASSVSGWKEGEP